MNNDTAWGERATPERNELRALIENCVRNPSNGNRHEQAIVDFIRTEIERARQDENKRVMKIIQNPDTSRFEAIRLADNT